jgi:hypothetical protein
MFAVTYQVFAGKKAALNPANSAKRHLRQLVPKTRRNTWNYAPKAA